MRLVANAVCGLGVFGLGAALWFVAVPLGVGYAGLVLVVMGAWLRIGPVYVPGDVAKASVGVVTVEKVEGRAALCVWRDGEILRRKWFVSSELRRA